MCCKCTHKFSVSLSPSAASQRRRVGNLCRLQKQERAKADEGEPSAEAAEGTEAARLVPASFQTPASWSWMVMVLPRGVSGVGAEAAMAAPRGPRLARRAVVLALAQ